MRTPFAEQVHQRVLLELKSHLRALERELHRLLEHEPPFAQLVAVLMSVPGVGLLFATHLLLLTQTSPEPVSLTHLAAHLGICPYERRSGKRVYARPTSRHYGPSQPRKLLHLAARSVVTHNARFRAYYQRKLAEGKPKRLVLNNVANKLLRICLAVLASGQPYDPKYVSTRPRCSNGCA